MPAGPPAPPRASPSRPGPPSTPAPAGQTISGQIVKQLLVKWSNNYWSNGQPVLVGTVSVAKSEHLSRLLTKNGVKHEVLNAKQHTREAEIVTQAGRIGAVTVATNMAGRGTDIMLGGNPEMMAEDLDDKNLSADQHKAAMTRIKEEVSNSHRYISIDDGN